MAALRSDGRRHIRGISQAPNANEELIWADRLAHRADRHLSARASLDRRDGIRPSYFKAVAIALNFAERLAPRDDTAVIITTEIRPAMRPYSIAVAPD